MGQKVKRSNFRVEVYPRRPGDLGSGMYISGFDRSEAATEGACEDIAEQIRRHVDDLPTGRGKGVEVVWDSEKVCEHCGRAWTEDTDVHNGGCCSKDAANLPAEEEVTP